MQTHEDLSRAQTVKTSSDRFFGLTFFVVFLIIALLPLLSRGAVRPVALGIALAFLAVSLAVPAWLAPLNRLWLKIGELLHRITSPIILGVMFFGVITPIGFLMRLAGKDLLRLRRDPAAGTYWVPCSGSANRSDGMKDQF